MKKINHPCGHCGRHEEGKWQVPCPSDDCPSHDKKPEIRRKILGKVKTKLDRARRAKRTLDHACNYYHHGESTLNETDFKKAVAKLDEFAAIVKNHLVFALVNRVKDAVSVEQPAHRDLSEATRLLEILESDLSQTKFDLAVEHDAEFYDLPEVVKNHEEIIANMRRAYANVKWTLRHLNNSNHKGAVHCLKRVRSLVGDAEVYRLCKKALEEIEGGTMLDAAVRVESIETQLDALAYSFAGKRHDEKHAPELPKFNGRKNGGRVRRADMCLDFYEIHPHGASPEEYEQQLTDLLCDLHHLSHRKGLAPSIIAECFRVARGHFITESNPKKK